MGKDHLEQAFEYIRNTPQIRDVVVSGGDPLILSDERIDYILTELRKIEHVEIIRIGSRMPVVLPQRITDEFCEIHILITQKKSLKRLKLLVKNWQMQALMLETNRCCSEGLMIAPIL